MKRQSVRGSAVEAACNTAAGLIIAWGLNLWLLPITPRQAAGLSVVYTVASVARSFVLRRMFNRWPL